MQHHKKASAPTTPVISAAPTSVLIPVYEYPESAETWAPIIAAKKANPTATIIAIVNPDSGPGTALDANYASAVASLKAAGVIVYGYVHTSYGAASASLLEAELRQWQEWYAPVGMFFDEMANTEGFEAYYSGLSAYARTLGMATTIGNPGTDTLPAYVGTVDAIVIYEAAGLPQASFLAGWHASYPKSNFAFIAYGVPSLNATTVKSLASSVGYVFVTNQVGDNPYNTLPPYLSAEVAAI